MYTKPLTTNEQLFAINMFDHKEKGHNYRDDDVKSDNNSHLSSIYCIPAAHYSSAIRPVLERKGSRVCYGHGNHKQSTGLHDSILPSSTEHIINFPPSPTLFLPAPQASSVLFKIARYTRLPMSPPGGDEPMVLGGEKARMKATERPEANSDNMKTFQPLDEPEVEPEKGDTDGDESSALSVSYKTALEEKFEEGEGEQSGKEKNQAQASIPAPIFNFIHGSTHVHTSTPWPAKHTTSPNSVTSPIVRAEHLRPGINPMVSKTLQSISDSEQATEDLTVNCDLEKTSGSTNTDNSSTSSLDLELNESNNAMLGEEGMSTENLSDAGNAADLCLYYDSETTHQGDVDMTEMTIAQRIDHEFSTFEKLKTSNECAQKSVSSLKTLIHANEKKMAMSVMRVVLLELESLWVETGLFTKKAYNRVKTRLNMRETNAHNAFMAAASIVVAILQIWLAENGHWFLLGVIAFIRTMLVLSSVN